MTFCFIFFLIFFGTNVNRFPFDGATPWLIPSSAPLWTFPNVIITPLMSCYYTQPGSIYIITSAIAFYFISMMSMYQNEAYFSVPIEIDTLTSFSFLVKVKHFIKFEMVHRENGSYTSNRQLDQVALILMLSLKHKKIIETIFSLMFLKYKQGEF